MKKRTFAVFFSFFLALATISLLNRERSPLHEEEILVSPILGSDSYGVEVKPPVDVENTESFG